VDAKRAARRRCGERTCSSFDVPGATGKQSRPVSSPKPLQSGRFELLDELGSGASGTVYRARLRKPLKEVPAGSLVAVKFLRQDLVGDAAAVAQIRHEGRIGLLVRHENVARIYAVGEETVLGLEMVYLVMELVTGRTLRALLLHTGPAVEDFARRIAADAARGLDALHRRGIVHRDLKLDNLALSEAGTLKLMDLGLARRGTGSRGGFYGSLAYAAPELLRGGTATPPSDLYALGIVLFEVVTGRHPFADQVEGDALIESHLERPPPRPSHFQPRISSFLERVILELLEKEPARRFHSARDLALTLEQGEASRWWRRYERKEPAAASRRRARQLRRYAPTPFFGREGARATLAAALRDATQGRGRALRLVGPDGIGRRRLLDETVEAWLGEREDLVFFGGEGDAGATKTLGAPFPQLLLDHYLRGDRPDSPQVRARLRARIHAEGGFDEAETEQLAQLLDGGDPGTSPLVRAGLLARALWRVGGRQRVLVLRVDRPERLDTTGRLVVERLLDDLGERRCLLLLVERADATREPFPDQTLLLEGLSVEDFARFGEALFVPGHGPDPQLLPAAHATLGGSPGNLLEALEDLAQRGRLEGEPGRYFGLRVDEIAPAEPLLERLRQRVLGFPPDQRFVLQCAAILGSQMQVADLAALADQTELSALAALSVFQGRIIRAERGRATFRHPDFREALLDLIPAGEKRELHERAAAILARRGASPVEIGLQWSRALAHERALPPLVEGLERLTQAGSRRASLKVVERVRLHLNALPRTPSNLELRLRYLCLSGQAHAQAEQGERATRDWRKAYRLALHLGRPFERAQALVGLGALAIRTGRMLAALQYLEQAEELMGERADPAARLVLARAYGVHSRALGYLGSTEEAIGVATLALAAVPADDLAVRPHLLVDLARLEALRLRFVESLAHLGQAMELFVAGNDPAGPLRVHLHRGHVLGTLGESRQARKELVEAVRRARALTDHRMHGRARLYLGQVRSREGEAAAAREHFLAARAEGQACGDLFTALLARLELGEDLAALEDEVELSGLPIPRALWLLRARTAALTAGDEARARQLAADVRMLAAEVTLPLHLQLAVLRSNGEGAQAAQLVRELSTRLPEGVSRRKFAAACRER
jgi:serine/threonine-protein kinase